MAYARTVKTSSGATAGQAELDLEPEVAEAASSDGPLEITGSQMGHLWDALGRAYDALGFHDATGGDEVFRQLVLARIIEPTSKEDSVREGIEGAGASFIIGERIPEVPDVIKQWRRENPDAVPEDGQVFVAPWPATGKKEAAGRRDKVTYYPYRADRARRTIRGIDQQIAKAENADAGKAAVKRNRFVKLTR